MNLFYGLLCAMSLGLSACGGGGNDNEAENDNTPSPTGAVIRITTLEFAQTHVIPAAGKQWSNAAGETIDLHLTGQRAALALTNVEPAALSGARVEGRAGSQQLGSVPLQNNDALPPSEAEGPRYSATAQVANLPEDWMQPGLQIRVTASGNTPSE